MLQEIENSPLVSIVIPLFNAKDYIAKTIESVILQSYENWELIVVDDCSTDGSYLVVEEFSKLDSSSKTYIEWRKILEVQLKPRKYWSRKLYKGSI